ncbi:CehA/McbA family metallohydrolase [Nonomuraea sp. NPDC050663]|uniref:CehA/McbA family metallohydrolase n=1 Tax=Nonomuraea sp. NPDC050663 TaxID=3364370 RepID=UPI00379F3343
MNPDLPDHHPPATVAAALADYRALYERHGVCWGEPWQTYMGEVATSAYLMHPFGYWAHAREDRDLARTVRDALGGAVVDNLPVLRVTPEGSRLEAVTLIVLGDEPVATTLLIDSSLAEPVTVEVDGVPYRVEPGGARLVATTTGMALPGIDTTGLTRRAGRATLTLRAGLPCRWGVTSEDGQGWWPAGAPPKLDAHRRPYFHGDDITLDVPAEPLTVSVGRGMEYAVDEVTVTPGPGEHRVVELTPERLYDAAAHGWYGGDLHVHLNWMGDAPASPGLAAAAQHGEDLHVLNLVAGNVTSARVYDLEAFEHWAGRDLPWSDGRHLARMGVEYRNDLLGHCLGFAPGGPPGRWHSGFVDADHPPNAVALGELREAGAVTGYGHPFHTTGDEFGDGRNCASREIVADAALGLVDCLDVLNHSSYEATAAVYRHLIGAGNRLAVSAGTDVVLSQSRRGTSSSPPGWARVYARVDGPLTAGSYGEAIALGRTFATTGPWLELSVNGCGPGETLRLGPGERVRVEVRSIGPEVDQLEIRTASEVVTGPPGLLRATLTITEPTYVVAVASGGRHPRSLHWAGVYAHTSPVYLDVAGEHVARPEDLDWCLAWLDRLEGLVRAEGRFEHKEQLDTHLALYERAREVYRARSI